MSIRTLLQTGLVATMAILTADGATAEAGHRDRYNRRRVDVDLDSLKSELRYGRSGPELYVRYEIEIEDASPYDAFDLVLHVTEHGRRVTDHDLINGVVDTLENQVMQGVEADTANIHAGAFADGFESFQNLDGF